VAKEPKPKSKPKGRALAALSQLADLIGGARLCYGEPVRDGGRTVIPVARVRASGGGGWGNGAANDGGGGGGGSLSAVPVGFIEIGPEGSRYERIPDPQALTRALQLGSGVLVTIGTAVAGRRALRDRDRNRRLLRRSS
jgi:uncharacterized spore protein YtfJ